MQYYKFTNRNITSVEVASAILHDIMEDNERILDLYQTKSYGFEAYLQYRFGHRVREVTEQLKIKPLENYTGSTKQERQLARFYEYCDMLVNAEFDIKVIKLADRINNMVFIKNITGHEKIRRYIQEAEDFYLAYCIIQPRMPYFYLPLRTAYNDFKLIKETIAA